MSAGPGIYNDIGRRAREVLHQCYPPNPPNSNSSKFFDMTLDSRCQISGIMPGLRVFSGLRLPLEGKVEMRYLHEYGGITAGMRLVTDQPVINASAVTGTGNFSIGGDLSFDSSTGEFEQYNAALSFSTRTFMASLALNDKADALRASCYWSGIPKTAVAAEVTHRMFDNDTEYTLGTQHLLFGGTTVKTRASSNGRIAALVEQQLLPWFYVSLTGDANARSVSNSACIGISAFLMSSITSEERERLFSLRNDPLGADLSFRLSIYHTQPAQHIRSKLKTN